MAESVVLIRKTQEGQEEIKTSFVGWSWTIFFFGAWPMLFRGYVSEFFGYGILIILLLLTVFGALILLIVLSIKWNNKKTLILLSQGFYPADQRNKLILKNNGIFID